MVCDDESQERSGMCLCILAKRYDCILSLILEVTAAESQVLPAEAGSLRQQNYS